MIEIMRPADTPDGPTKVFVTDDDPPQIQVMLPFEVAAALRELFYDDALGDHDSDESDAVFEAMKLHMVEAGRMVRMLPSWNDLVGPVPLPVPVKRVPPDEGDDS